MHAKSGGSSGEPPDFLFIPAACRSRKDLPRSAGGGGRARNTGNRPRDAEDGATGAGCGARETGARARAQGAGPRVRVRGAGRGCGTRKTRAWGAGRKTRNTWTRTRTRARGAGRRTQNAERRTQNTGYWPRAAEHGKRGHGAQETGHKPPCMDRSATAYTRPAPQQPAGAVHSRAPSATGTCNNPPGPSTAGRLPPRAAATCRAYESESRRCRRARRTCCCRAAPRPT